MSSRGPAVRGTDGTDFAHRQRILPHYQQTALTKKRLKFLTILHMLIACLMLVKLTSTILDMLDIFWEDLEALYIPPATPWEWVWLSSVLYAIVSFRAIKYNSLIGLKIFMAGITLFGLLPLLYCAYYWLPDFRTFLHTRDASKTSERWRDYPVALYWYIFLFVALQVHAAELYLSIDLHKSLNNTVRKRRQ